VVSKLAQNLIGSEIIKIGNQVNELKAQGAEIANLTIGDLDSKIYPIPAVEAKYTESLSK
jgi:aspartate aminotransferase